MIRVPGQNMSSQTPSAAAIWRNNLGNNYVLMLYYLTGCCSVSVRRNRQEIEVEIRVAMMVDIRVDMVVAPRFSR